MDAIFVGGGGEAHGTAQSLLLKYGNRHGLIAGATGTGKTVTLQVLAEGFAAAGVPVFMADVKGDLSGIGAAGSPGHKLHDAFTARAARYWQASPLISRHRRSVLSMGTIPQPISSQVMTARKQSSIPWAFRQSAIRP